MKNRPPFAGRSFGLLVLGVLLGGIAGSIVSYFMAGLFPDGPVRDFFFKSLPIGIPTFTVNLGFMAFTLGFSVSVTTAAVLLVGLAVYFWYKF
jgi:hypothetical protein